MRVASVCRGHGFAAYNSLYYEDPREGKTRQIDVVAHHFVTGEDGQHLLQVVLVIECKYSAQPWIGFVDPKNRIGRGIVFPFPGSRFRREGPWATVYAASRSVTILPELHFRRGSAFGIAQVPADPKAKHKGDSGDPAWASVQQVTSAAENVEVAEGSEFTTLSIVIPIIVIDGHLFECYLDADAGSIEATEVDNVTVGIRDARSPVEVVTIDHLDELLAAIKKFADAEWAVIERAAGTRSSD